jgi:hypothetical protein
MLDDAQLTTFRSADDDFLRTQALIAESGQSIRPGLLEMLANTSARIGNCLKALPPPFRAVRYRGMTFILVPKGDGFSLAVLPEAQVVKINQA